MMTTVKILLKKIIVPTVRAFIRFSPFEIGKRAYWNYIICPVIVRCHIEYKTSTIFGDRIVGNTKDLIQRNIYYFGIWEPYLTRWIGQRLSAGDTFIDVGANIGYYSLYASRIVGESGKVVAIEASPTIYERLMTHVHLNSLNNVKVLNIAVTNEPQKLKIYFASESNIGRTGIFNIEGGTLECEVEGLPLPMILEPNEIRDARLIKIDVEGAELMVAEGLYPMLQSCRDDLEIIMEISPEKLAEQGKLPNAIIDRFRDFGFHAYGIENDYGAENYLPPYKNIRPKRINDSIDCQLDVVFSRQESEWL
jgi:FkbM family methyltransferase